MSNHLQRPLVPDNIKNLKAYVAGKTIKEVDEAYHPSQIAKLASNENRLGCSSLVAPAVQEALQEIQDYPDPAARQLRAELAKKNDVSIENIVVGAGSESIISILCRTFFKNNDIALTADATFVGFFVQANIRGITLQKVPVTSDYRFDVEAIVDAITDCTKMIYIANPNNPTGTYINNREFEYLMDEVPRDILVIMDQAYHEYAYDVDDYPDALDYNYPNVITLRTFSKAYGLAGMRVGYAIAHKEPIANMLKTKLTFEPTAAAQAAAIAALQDEAFLSESRRVVEKGRMQLYDFFDGHNVQYISSISNSVLMICDSEKEAASFTQKMLKKGVILRQTQAFGVPEGVRITIGTEKDMRYFEQCFEDIDW